MEDALLVKKAFEEGRTHISAGAILIIGRKVLIIRRKKDDSRPGDYEMPSGGTRRGELPSNGALRELKEETNIDGGMIRFANHFDFSTQGGKKVRQLNYLVRAKKPIKIRLTEHDDFRWAGKKGLKDIKMSEECKACLLSVL
jgi:8-oxo-dGTP pyrophosphatase MutT (NUDIX family)